MPSHTPEEIIVKALVNFWPIDQEMEIPVLYKWEFNNDKSGYFFLTSFKNETNPQKWLESLSNLEKQLNYIFLCTGMPVEIVGFDVSCPSPEVREQIELYFGTPQKVKPSFKHLNSFTTSDFHPSVYPQENFIELSEKSNRKIRLLQEGMMMVNESNDTNTSLIGREIKLNNGLFMLISALEGLLLNDEVIDGITKEFKSRAAEFYLENVDKAFIPLVAGGKLKKSDAEKFFECSYNIRSKIVHGTFSTKEIHKNYIKLSEILHISYPKDDNRSLGPFKSFIAQAMSLHILALVRFSLTELNKPDKPSISNMFIQIQKILKK